MLKEPVAPYVKSKDELAYEKRLLKVQKQSSWFKRMSKTANQFIKKKEKIKAIKEKLANMNKVSVVVVPKDPAKTL